PGRPSSGEPVRRAEVQRPSGRRHRREPARAGGHAADRQCRGDAAAGGERRRGAQHGRARHRQLRHRVAGRVIVMTWEYDTILTDGLTEREAYKLLTGIVVPRPIAWITTCSEDGGVNLAPFSAYVILS